MSNHYSPQDFFRRVPNKLLGQYFAAKGVLADIDFTTLHETKIVPLYEAWKLIPDESRASMDAEFHMIGDMANEGGSKAILDVADEHDDNLKDMFAEMDGGYYEHAFWTFIERNHYWKEAHAFYHADNISSTYWSKYKNIPRKQVDISKPTINKFEKELGEYLHAKSARGKNCQVECYKRDNLDYFFAFPEDYAQSVIEWDKQKLERRSHRPAFEIIFVYSQDEGKLDIYVPKNKQIIPDLHRLFCECILGVGKTGDNKKDQKVYDLNALKRPNFPFIYEAASGTMRWPFSLDRKLELRRAPVC